MSQIMRKGDSVDRVRDMLSSPGAKTQLAIALGSSSITPDRMTRLVITSMRRNSYLAQCGPESVVGAVIQAAQLGLEVDNGLGHAYLVPYKGDCTLIIGYRGLVELARRTGQISTIFAAVVHENDEFEYALGTDPKVHHVPRTSSRGLPTHVYAVAKLADGATQFDVLSVEDVEAVRKRSPGGAKGSGPWATDWAEMAKKTALRRLCKMLPMTVETAEALEREDGYGQGRRGYSTTWVDAESSAPAASAGASVEAGGDDEGDQ